MIKKEDAIIGTLLSTALGDFVDAAVVAIAEVLDLRRIATTDRRDFGALQESMKLELLPVQTP